MSKATQRKTSAFSAGKYAARTGATKHENLFVKGHGLNSVWHAGFVSVRGGSITPGKTGKRRSFFGLLR